MSNTYIAPEAKRRLKREFPDCSTTVAINTLLELMARTQTPAPQAQGGEQNGKP